jgi:hypothetical protein
MATTGNFGMCSVVTGFYPNGMTTPYQTELMPGTMVFTLNRKGDIDSNKPALLPINAINYGLVKFYETPKARLPGNNTHVEISLDEVLILGIIRAGPTEQHPTLLKQPQSSVACDGIIPDVLNIWGEVQVGDMVGFLVGVYRATPNTGPFIAVSNISSGTNPPKTGAGILIPQLIPITLRIYLEIQKQRTTREEKTHKKDKWGNIGYGELVSIVDFIPFATVNWVSSKRYHNVLIHDLHRQSRVYDKSTVYTETKSRVTLVVRAPV